MVSVPKSAILEVTQNRRDLKIGEIRIMEIDEGEEGRTLLESGGNASPRNNDLEID